MNAVHVNGQQGQAPFPLPSRETIQDAAKRYQLLRSQGATEHTSAEMAHLSQMLHTYKVRDAIHARRRSRD